MPLVSRNVYDLIQLSAGVNAVNGSPNSSDSMQSIQNISVGRPGVDVSADTINGSLVGSVYYMIDGAPIGIAENNSAAIIPAMNVPEDGVEEVRVETQNTPASYQSGGAGVISLVTKSGTNKFHGDALEYSGLTSWRRTTISTSKANSRSGRPILHLRSTAIRRVARSVDPSGRTNCSSSRITRTRSRNNSRASRPMRFPPAAKKIGDFSQMGFTIYDPTQPDYTSGPLAGTRQPFAGNIIPNPNPIGLLYLGNMPKCNYPDPTTCDSATTDVSPNYAVPGLDPFKAHRFDARVDWVASDKQRIFTRFSYDKLMFSTANVFPSPGWDLDYAQNTTNGRNVLIADDITLNSSTVLNLRYSFTRHYESQGGPPAYLSNNITTQGFPASLAAQVVYKQLPFIVFNDVGGGVGGTADYNNFVTPARTATPTPRLRRSRASTRFQLDSSG